MTKVNHRSFTRYDADYMPISVNNTSLRDVHAYYSAMECFESYNQHMEDIIWLISSARDESHLVLHQHVQGII